MHGCLVKRDGTRIMSGGEASSEPTALPEIAEALQVVGLAQGEARTYLHLLRLGPSKVSRLAPYLDVSRSKVYQLLDDLAQKGFVSKTPERPTVYHPVAPDEAFEIGRETLTRRSQRLETVRSETLATLERLHRVDTDAEPTVWNKIETAPKIYEVIQRVVGRAERSVWVASNHEPTLSPGLPFVEEAWSVARKKLQKGTEVRALLGPNQAVFEHAPAWLLSETSRVRVLEIEETLHFLVADRREVVFWVEPEPARSIGAGENIAVQTDAESPVATHALLFERLWADAPRPPSDGTSGACAQT